MDLTIYNTDDGIHLPELGLWLDSSENAKNGEIVFVSHAHSDHISKHSELILSPATSRLLKMRYWRTRKEHIIDFFQPRCFSHKGINYKLTLLPAGHILGSSMLYIEVPGKSILYTGDFKLSGSLTSESCKPTQADWLLIETTFGKPEYNFPDINCVSMQITTFCKSALSINKIPVLFAYSLGKSQDLIMLLGKSGFNIMAHNQITKISSIYRALGIKLPHLERFSPSKAKGKVLIIPPSARNILGQFKSGEIVTALVSGWATDKDVLYRFRVDEAFALSNHSDYNEIINFVKLVNPSRIFTIHGFTREFAISLRTMGFDAEALEESGQKWLPACAF